MTISARDPGRVLLTGGRGFLGRALTQRMARDGIRFVASDISGDPSCDITDAAAVEDMVAKGGFDTILHCGAVSGPMLLSDRPAEIWRINATGTVNILEAARRHSVRRVVVCSTSEVYGDLRGAVDEDTLARPRNLYGASKLAAEHAVLAYAAEHDVDAVALRLGWIYGPGRTTPTVLEAALRAVAAGQDAALDAHPDDMTHYIHVDDAVAGVMAAAVARTLPHRVYNISSGPALPMSDVIGTIIRAYPGTRLSLLAARPPEIHPDHVVAVRAQRDMGFQPRIPFDEGIRAYVRSLAT